MGLLACADGLTRVARGSQALRRAKSRAACQEHETREAWRRAAERVMFGKK